MERARPSFDWIRAFSMAFAGLAAVFVAIMVVSFWVQSVPVWRHAGWGHLTGLQWFFRAQLFGAAPMLYGTIMVAATGLLVATPIGIGVAIFTAEILPGRLRIPVIATIQLLAGVPSVVFGLLGVLVLRGWVERLLQPFDPLSGDTLLTAGLLLAVMILPTIAALADDALRGVPATARFGARALGLTRAETLFGVTLPQAWPGLVAAVLLGLGRAVGETIAVFLVVGRQDNQWPSSLLSLRPLTEAGQTITSKLGGTETFLAYGDPLHWGAIMGLASILLALTIAISVLGAWLGDARAR